MPRPPVKYTIPESSIEPFSNVQSRMARNAAAAATAGSQSELDVSVSHTMTSISGNMPPGLLATVTITTPGGTASTRNSQGRRRTPPATSAHGTRPSQRARRA